MSSKIKNFGVFVGHIRADNTISEISKQLESYMDFYSSDYEEEFLENYVGKAKELLDEFSTQILKMAEMEIVKREE